MEKEEQLREFIQTQVIEGERLGISAREACEEAQVGKEMVEAVFGDLARQGKGRIEDSPDGLIFMKNIEGV